MSFIERALAWLRLGSNKRSRGDVQAHAKRVLRELRATVDAEELALRAAEENGPKGADALAGVEKQLKAAYGGALARTEALYAPVLNTLDARLTHLLARMSPDRLDAAERACSVEHARLRTGAMDRLVGLRRTERRAQRALRAFRFRHQLTREASYPESGALHFSALALVCVLEAVANTTAFSEGSELGLTGGFFNGLLVAATNVAFALCAGRAAMGLFHRRWGIKAVTALLLGGWATFQATFALAVAHYRIALIESADSASSAALQSLLATPFAIGDLISVLLTVLTIAFGFAALLAGLGTDDRYPGYGAIDRSWRRAQAQLRELREHTLGALDAVFLRARPQMRAIAEEVASVQDRFRQTLETMKRGASSLEHAIAEVDAAYREGVLNARAAFAGVTGVTLIRDEPDALHSSSLLATVHERIATATLALQEFPVRRARFQTEMAATEARIQRQHEKALEAMPAFFASADLLAEQETVRDEDDAARPRQGTLWADETRPPHDAARAPTAAAA